jgi:23S rRNA pseudouridine1911/1915/1917 synthase
VTDRLTLRATEADAGKRLDAFLHERLGQFSRSRLQQWIKNGRVQVDGALARASSSVRPGTEIVVEPADLPPLQATPEEIPLQILYEDGDVVVVDKPAGMVVHAGAGHHEGTLVNALLHHFGKLSAVNGDFRPGIVHRIDRETSGILVVARTDRAHLSLAAQFHDRKVDKQYLALVHGRLKGATGVITDPITRDPVRRTRMTCSLGTGRTAHTEYRVLQQFDRAALLSVRIRTGRTHQIRVHLASRRHPIVGDRLYGAPAAGLPGIPPPSRFYLHAANLRFRSPSSDQLIEVTSPLPPDFQEILNLLRSVRD